MGGQNGTAGLTENKGKPRKVQYVLFAGGAPQPVDTPPVIRGGRTFLPVRAIAEALGLDVAWDGNKKKVTLTGEERVIELWVGRSEAVVEYQEGDDVILSRIPIDPANPDVVPFIENGRVMLPLRFIAEALDLDVSFEPETQQITIKRPHCGSRGCRDRERSK